ncbi:dynactin-associated protein [Tenrec ecaudatus]|uniref:dynactin-associated protein n=1 Tax=Tenrec ecaudatus TaxID=94439 RepID=UPI003F5A35C4
MNGKPQQKAGDIEQSGAEMLPINPYGTKEGSLCACRWHPATLQPQWVTAKPVSLWKTFLVCLLACLLATTLVALVLYFVHFGILTNNTTVIVQSEGKSNHVICISGSAPSPTSGPQPGFQPTPETNQSSSTEMPPPAVATTAWEHDVIIDGDK